MRYEQQDIIKAFQLFTRLTQAGYIDKEDAAFYQMNEDIQSLMEQFSREVNTVLVLSGEILYLVPVTSLSPFHIKNEQLRRELGASATNGDVYMMYFAIIVLIGEFYNSYVSSEVQRDFLTTSQWLEVIQERIEALKQHSPEGLQQHAENLEYNWLSIIEKWEALNDLKESAVNQKGNTVSRLSFLNKVWQFLLKEQLVEQIGVDEYNLTEKAKTIVQRYFMELDYNRGVLQFMYRYDERREEDNAGNS